MSGRALPSSTSPAPKPASARVGPGEVVGVTEAMIVDVVDTFYATIRQDTLLGPIFNREIAEADWPAHLAKLCDFWSSVLLMSGRFKGTPMTVHAAIAEISPAHFAHWLDLFRQTVEAQCPPAAAALFVAKSQVIAQSLQLGIAVSRGELPPASERLLGQASA